MRLPLAIPMETRDGSIDQDGHLTNAVVEDYEGAFYVAPRPGLSAMADITGAASGLVCYNNELIALAGTTIYVITNSTLFSLNFDSDTTGGSNVSNSGTGGAITLIESTISTLHSVSGTKSLNIANNSSGEASAMVFDDVFFASDYSISFSLYIDGSDLTSDNVGIIELIFAYKELGGGGFSEFWRWEVLLNTTISDDVEGFIQCVQQTPVTNTKSWPVTSFMLDSWNSISISKTGQDYSVTLNGSELSVSQDDTLTPLASSITVNQMFNGVQLEGVWNDPTDKVFIDDFIVTSANAAVPSGTLAAGQYDFAQSSV